MSNLTSKNIVVANVIIRAGQSLSLAEKRILFAGIAQLGGKNDMVVLRAEEYAEAYGVDIDTAYRQLKIATKNIFNRYLRWQIQDGKAIGVRTTRWVVGYDYFDKEGYVKFKFNEMLFPFLFELTEKFTRYKLSQASGLRSIYSWRLLELLEQQKKANKDNKRWLKISIEDFSHAMDAKGSYNTNFSLLRNRIINPAVNELKEKDGWLIDWKPVKRGRKVAMLEFEFERDKQQKLF